MAVNAYAWGALWLYASAGRRLLRSSFPESQRRIATLLFTSGTVAYTFSVIIAVVNAFGCLAFHAGLAIFYALDPVSRRASRGGQPSTSG
jgi:hypothetical protein